MKKALIWILIAALVLITVPIGIWKVSAGSPPAYTIKVLEVSDTGSYKLQSAISGLSGAANVTVDTMRMKTFVALREQLAGKYDAIYFGQGTYSPTPTTALTPSDSSSSRFEAHRTTSIMNDITDLKIKEVQESYINAGLPVLFFSSTTSGDKNFDANSKLYRFYTSNKAKSNVITITSDTDKTQKKKPYTIDSDLKVNFKKLLTGSLLKQRPMLVVKSAPSATQSYKAGDTLDFNFDLYRADQSTTTTATGEVNVKLYVNVDEVFANTDDQVVANVKLTNSGGKLSYTVPNTYSGPLYWHLEATFSGTTSAIEPKSSGLLTYAEGKFMLRNEVTHIRVLQVTNNAGDGNLTNSTNRMNPTFLKNDTLGYDINITAIPFSSFVKPEVYQHLNGNYDMIIFGFADEFGRGTNSQLTGDVAKAVNDFTKTGQSVMFTHDTILTNPDNTNSDWAKYFGVLTGQYAPEGKPSYKTNIGYANPVGSNQVKEINSGLLTQFPFDLRTADGATSGTGTSFTEYYGNVAWTHNQYYVIDLENRDIVPWYTMMGDPRDTDDSWNHYYTYSNKNVTYSGTGHTSSAFPVWEQKLFVNTMYRAFMGSNHAPEIKVITPTETELNKPSYLKDFLLSYQVDDLDLADTQIYSSVKVKVNGTYVDQLAIPEQAAYKGQVITQTIANTLPLSGGNIDFEITARDKQGAIATKTVSLKITELNANLVPERDVYPASETYEYPIGQEVEMRYTLTPQNIPVQKVGTNEQLRDTLEISNIIYNEKLPKGLVVSGKAPAEITVTAPASADSGSTLKYEVPTTITYKLSGDHYVPTDATPIRFTVFFNTNSAGEYLLQDASVSYQDIHIPKDTTPPASGGTSSGTATESLPFLKDYSLLVLGKNLTTISGNTIKGRAAFNGPATLSPPTIGEGLKADPAFPSLYTVGNLNIQGGKVLNGPLLTNGTLTFNQFGLTDTVAMAAGNISLTNNWGISNSSIWTKGNLSIPGSWVNANLFAVGDFTLGGGGMNGGNATYGGTYYNENNYTAYTTHATPESITASFNKQWDISNAKGIHDFTAVNNNLVALSSAYSAMAENGTKTHPLRGDGTPITNELLLSGDQDLNIFNLSAADLDGMYTIHIKKKTQATTVINWVGSDLEFAKSIRVYNDNQQLSGQAGDSRILFNFSGNGTLNIHQTDIPGSILAPNANVMLGGGNVYGSMVVRQFTQNGGFLLDINGFQGAGPVAPTPSTPTEPVAGRLVTLPFPNRSINALLSLEDILLTPVSLWVGETFKVPYEYAPQGVKIVKETWSSKNADIVTVSDTGTVSGIAEGQALITLEAQDKLGNTVSRDVKVTVQPAPLSIGGSNAVNLNDTITDLHAVYDSSQVTISNIQWSFVGADDATRARLGSIANQESVSLTGLNLGEVTLQLQATLTKKSGTRSSQTFTARHTVKVINPLNSVTLNGPDWISVNKVGNSASSSAQLTAVTNPVDVRIQSTAWTILNTDAAGTLLHSSTGSSTNNVLNASAQPGKAIVQATVTPTGVNPISKSSQKTIRIVDVAIQDQNGGTLPDNPAVYFNTELVLKSSFLTADLDTWTDRPSNYSWSVQNLKKDAGGQWIVDSSSTPPYAQLTDTGNGYASLTPINGLEGKVRVIVTVGGMTSFQDIDVQARLTALQLPSPITIQEGQSINLNNLLNPTPGAMVGKLSQILPVLEWNSANIKSAAVGNAKEDKGMVTGIKGGTSTIVTVTYPSPDGVESNNITTKTEVRVTSRTQPTDPTNPTDPGTGPAGDNLF